MSLTQGGIVKKPAFDEAGINPVQVPVTVSRQDTIYLEQDDGIQDAFPPATGQARTSMRAQSSSVTVNPSHTPARCEFAVPGSLATATSHLALCARASLRIFAL